MERFEEVVRRIASEEFALDANTLTRDTQLDPSGPSFRRFWKRSILELGVDEKTLAKTWPGHWVTHRQKESARALAMMASIVPGAEAELAHSRDGGEIPTIGSLSSTFREMRHVPSEVFQESSFRPWSRRRLVLTYSAIPAVLPAAFGLIALLTHGSKNCCGQPIWPPLLAFAAIGAATSLGGFFSAYRVARKAIDRGILRPTN